jgi:hypothetical protein
VHVQGIENGMKYDSKNRLNSGMFEYVNLMESGNVFVAGNFF